MLGKNQGIGDGQAVYGHLAPKSPYGLNGAGVKDKDQD